MLLARRLLTILLLSAVATAAAQTRPTPLPSSPPAPRAADIDALVERARKRDAEAEYALAMAAYQGHGVPANASQAFRLAQRAAGRGHLEAQVLLAFMHQHGIGTAADPAAALAGYLDAAGRGHARAQLAAGWMLANGEGAAKDEAAARGWFAKAAAQNLRDAHYNLATLLEHGIGGGQDLPGAVAAYRRAAESGIAEAALPLARLLERGVPGHAPDPAAALPHYVAAAEQGSREAQFAAGRIYLSRASAANALENAVKWLEISGNAGEREAFVMLSRHFDEHGGDTGKRRAAQYYRLAADRGHAPSARRLAYLLHEKAVPEAAPGETDARMRVAAGAGDPELQYRLAVRLASREPAYAAALEEAVSWYRRAAEQGDPRAALALGIALEDGRGTPRNAAEANRWFEATAKAKLPEAIYRLASQLDRGVGARADHRRALELFAAAAELGHERAKERIERLLPPPPTLGFGRPGDPFPSGNDPFRGMR